MPKENFSISLTYFPDTTIDTKNFTQSTNLWLSWKLTKLSAEERNIKKKCDEVQYLPKMLMSFHLSTDTTGLKI